MKLNETLVIRKNLRECSADAKFQNRIKIYLQRSRRRNRCQFRKPFSYELLLRGIDIQWEYGVNTSIQRKLYSILSENRAFLTTKEFFIKDSFLEKDRIRQLECNLVRNKSERSVS